jgi:hypothetical protein
MRRSLVLALPLVVSLGCAASTDLSIDGGTTGGGATSGVGGKTSAAGTNGGTAGRGSTTGAAGTTGGTAGRGSITGAAGTTGGTAGRGGTAGTTGATTGRGGTNGAAGTTGRGGTNGAAGTTGDMAGRGGTTGAAGTTGRGGATGAAGTNGAGGTTGAGGSTTTWASGNPNGSCSSGVPAKGQPADTSSPTTVVGTGTAASCTFSALQTAVTLGGVITFNCGNGAVTIPISATMNVPINKNTVIDGGKKVTLDGGHAVQILSFNSSNFQANSNGLTLQHIAIVNGKSTPTEVIPTAPAPCSQGYDDGEGGALFMRDGNLTVIDCIFTGNQAAQLGPDTGGGAIYIEGSKNGAVIVGSTFTNNSGANAGAIGSLFAELDIYNSLFTNNTATGNGANTDDATMCSVINNGQNEVGSGGNGGAIYGDGNSFNITLCGDAVLNNAAGAKAFGGGLFFTSDNMAGILTITDTAMTGNTGGSWTSVSTGSVTNAGTAIGTNAKSITLSGDTIQGVP